MGHIVKIREQIEIAEKDLRPTKSPTRVRFELGTFSNSSQNLSSKGTVLPLVSPSSLQSAKSSLGTSWQDCVQGIGNLLPMPYSEHWIGSLEHLLHGDGPLPECWRIYIAIMGLCRHEVTWVVRALTLEFLAAEGDRRWLSGLEHVPTKLRALSQINNLLAHRPWLLTSQHIQSLIKGEESWSLAEICQAICLLTHFHALASFMHSCLPFLHNCSPLKQQLASSSGQTHTLRNSPCKANPSTLSNGSSSSSEALAQQQINLPHKIDKSSISPATKLTNVSPQTSYNSPISPTKGSLRAAPASASAPFSTSIDIPESCEVAKPQGILKTLGNTPGSKREIQASPQPSKQSKSESRAPSGERNERALSSLVREYSFLCVDLSFTYEEFPSSHNLNTNLFKIREFNWLDHGYCLMSRIMTEVGKMLDDRFRSIKTLTHPSWDTAERCPLQVRTAVWNFIQSLFGIHHDEYNYDLLKKFLSQETMLFIKKAACCPESLGGKVPAALTKSSSNAPSEVIPLSIVMMEGRLQSELLYALRAIIPNQC